MTDEEALDAVHEVMVAKGFSRAPVRGGGPPRYEGCLWPARRRVSMAVEFPCPAFTTLPHVILLDRSGELPGVTAHIETGDRLCYAAPGSIVPDMYDPTGTALLMLLLAERTLAACIAGEADGDVRAEFPQHWRGAAFLTELGADARSGPARLVPVFRKGELQTRILAREGGGAEWFPGVPGRKKDTEPAFLLNPGTELDLPAGMSVPDTLADLLLWAKRLKQGFEADIARAIEHRDFRKAGTNLFFTARNGCVGVHLEAAVPLSGRGFRPGFSAGLMLAHPAEIRLLRLSGQRVDRKFIFSRNLGSRPSLAGRRIALVGCGTIGSHLARLLVQGGAGSCPPGLLTLVDDDVLSAGNTGRHLLPPRWIGAPKADALAEELAGQFPGSRIRAVTRSAMDASVKLTGAELVIDATGEEGLSVALNSRFVAHRPNAPDALYVRLFGNGAAAQALFVRGTGGGACFKCLRPAAGQRSPFNPMKPDVEPTFAPAGCGEGAFQPFGPAAPVIAAGLASAMTMDWAAGYVEPALRTLRVDAGVTEHLPDCSPGAVEECPACGVGPAP